MKKMTTYQQVKQYDEIQWLMIQNKALRIARKAHDGQTDECGLPYINHPMAVESLVYYYVCLDTVPFP